MQTRTETGNVTYEEQRKIALLEVLAELPNFIAVAVSAILSGSLIVWMDFVDSFGNMANSSFLLLLSSRLRNDLKYRYNYGIGKVEAISSLCSNLFICIGLACVFFFSVVDLLTPKQPGSFIFYVLFLKVINVSFDTYFLISQYRLRRTSRTSITDASYLSALKNFCFDFTALCALLISYLLRNNPLSWYFSPVVCIVIGIVILISCIHNLRDSIEELTDKTLPEDEQLKILKAVASRFEDYEELESVNSRKVGTLLIIDLNMKFSPEKSYQEIRDLADHLSERLGEMIPGCVVNIVIAGSRQLK